MAMEILLGEIVETSCNNPGIMVLYKSCKNRCPGPGHSALSLAAGKRAACMEYVQGWYLGGNYD